MQLHIPNQLLIKTWDRYQKNTMVHMCRNIIVNHLLNNGTELVKNDTIFVPALSIQDAITEHWYPFIATLIDQVLAFGFAVVIIDKDESQRSLPSVVDPHLFSITIETVNNKRIYTVQSTELDTSKVLIYDHFGFQPVLCNGQSRLTSIAWKVEKATLFLDTIRNACQQMEANKSHPHFFAEVQENTRARQEGLDFDYYADADAAETSLDLQYNRNSVNIQLLEKQTELYNQYMGKDNTAKLKLEDIVQLPTGLHVVSTPQNTGRQDIAQLTKAVQEEVCAVIGVPRAMIISNSAYQTNTEGTEQTFTSTIKWWSKQLSLLLTDLYTKIYLQGKIKLQKNIYMAKRKHQIRVQFKQKRRRTTLEEIQQAYDNGILTWESYSTTVVEMLGLPTDVRNTQPPVSDSSNSSDVDSAEVVAVSNKRKRTAR